MKKNAFTLIELLAIIVILAIIAVITTPIILNIIDNSKKGTAIDSAYGFKDSLQKHYITSLLDDSNGNLPSGYVDISTLTSDFTVSGVRPSEGWVKLNKGTVEDYSLRIGDYVVTKVGNSDPVAVKNGEISSIAEQSVVSYKVDSYVKAALSANSTLSKEDAYTVSDMSEVTTDKADSGWIHLDNIGGSVVVVDYSLTYGSLTANYSELSNGTYISVFGSARNKPNIMTKGYYDSTNHIQYYTGQSEATVDTSDNIVFFDPINGTKNCATASTYPKSTNSAAGYKGSNTNDPLTSCLRWYVFSIDDNGTNDQSDDIVNMILDHNTSTGIQWHDEDGRYGPTVAVAQLADDTSGWTSNKLIAPSPYTAEWSFGHDHVQYTIPYTSMHARLIEADEIARVMNDSSWTYNDVDAIADFDSLKPYLLTGLSSSAGNNGYWTSSPVCFIYRAIVVKNDGNMGRDYVTISDYGVRPIISVLKSDIF